MPMSFWTCSLRQILLIPVFLDFIYFCGVRLQCVWIHKNTRIKVGLALGERVESIRLGTLRAKLSVVFLKTILFTFKIDFYVSIFLFYGAFSSRDAQASRGPGFSCYGAWALGCWLSGWVRGLSCPMTYEVFLCQGLNPCSLHWQVDSSLLDH